MRFSPGATIRWLQARSRAGRARKIAKGKARRRPPTPQFVVDALLAIKRDKLLYSAGHIACTRLAASSPPRALWQTCALSSTIPCRLMTTNRSAGYRHPPGNRWVRSPRLD